MVSAMTMFESAGSRLHGSSIPAKAAPSLYMGSRTNIPAYITTTITVKCLAKSKYTDPIFGWLAGAPP